MQTPAAARQIPRLAAAEMVEQGLIVPLHDDADAVHTRVRERRERKVDQPVAPAERQGCTRVAAVRAMQAQRYQGLGFTCNAQLPSGMLRRYCPLAPAAEKLLRGAFERMGYSARAYDRILRVARTIADMNGVEQIGAAELMEALQYRRMDRAVGK